MSKEWKSKIKKFLIINFKAFVITVIFAILYKTLFGNVNNILTFMFLILSLICYAVEDNKEE